MGPIQQIKAGIESQDWEVVVAGYNAMTGEGIDAPATEAVDDYDEVNIANIRRILIEELKKREVTFIPTVFDSVPGDTVDVEFTTVDEKHVACQEQDIDNQGEYQGELQAQQSEKETHYKNKQVFITTEPDPAEVAKNAEKAKRVQALKTRRPPPQKYNVTCNECGSTFESERRVKDIGEKCNQCMKRTARER